LYENNIIDFLKPMLVDISKKRLSDKIVTETLIELLRIADNLLKYVSEFVKKALQAKKANAPVNDGLANQAEKLLHSNKPLVVSCSFLISLLVNEDADLNDLSCKILWIIMQLFGSECKDLVNQENINILLASILNSNSKRQKILLRIVKRLITSDKQNLETFKTIGQNFIESMKVLKNNANAEANVSLSSMIDEILKLA
jgi:serine/threonine-protein kinase ULK4